MGAEPRIFFNDDDDDDDDRYETVLTADRSRLYRVRQNKVAP